MFRKAYDLTGFAFILASFIIAIWWWCKTIGEIGKWILSTATADKNPNT